MISSIRRTLLASAITGTCLLSAIPAQAQCVVSAGSLTCATTDTTNTVNAGASPSSDRVYNIVSGPTPFLGTVTAGATVSGFGLGINDTAVAGAGVTFVNNGVVQINPGNSTTNPSTAGSPSGALALFVDSGNIAYSGAGTIAHLGTAGSGAWFQHSGVGNINASFGGDVTGTATFTGIFAEHVGTAGNIRVDTAAGRTISAGFTGVWLTSTPALVGNLELTNNAPITIPRSR